MLRRSSKSLEFGKFSCVVLIAIPFGCHETINVIEPSTMPLDSYHSDSPIIEAGSSVSLEVDKSIRTFLQKCGMFHYSDVLTLGALTEIDSAVLRIAASTWHDEFAPLPKPILVVNIGEPTRYVALEWILQSNLQLVCLAFLQAVHLLEYVSLTGLSSKGV